MGAVLGVTLTVKVALAVAPVVSVTVKLKTELVALQAAITSAVTLPEGAMTTLEIVTPAPETGVMLTDKELAAWSASATVAICELADGLPCCRVSELAAMVGTVLTKSVKLELAVAPQLSVAVTVMVYVPAGAALAIVTTPAALTLKVPPKLGTDETLTLITEPLSVGAADGVTVAPVPKLSVRLA